MRVTEATIQAVLMHWAMEDKHHQFVIPNSRDLFHWECDLLSVTRSDFVHEYEIKLNRADYNRDSKKRKHHWLGDSHRSPAYFWYATYQFEIEPPKNAGWLYVWYNEARSIFEVDVKKNAPRISGWKIPEKTKVDIARLLSYRIKNYYGQFLRGER